jgi:hypothetical protein
MSIMRRRMSAGMSCQDFAGGELGFVNLKNMGLGISVTALTTFDPTFSTVPAMVATDEYVDFESRLQAAAVAPTKKAMSLPQDLQFYRSLDSEFGEDLDACSDRLLNMINKMLAAVDGLSFQGKGKARLETVDDVLDNFNAIVGARIDSLLERTVRNSPPCCA